MDKKMSLVKSYAKRHCKCSLATRSKPPYSISLWAIFFPFCLYGFSHFINHRFEYLPIFIKPPFPIPRVAYFVRAIEHNCISFSLLVPIFIVISYPHTAIFKGLKLQPFFTIFVVIPVHPKLTTVFKTQFIHRDMGTVPIIHPAAVTQTLFIVLVFHQPWRPASGRHGCEK